MQQSEEFFVSNYFPNSTECSPTYIVLINYFAQDYELSNLGNNWTAA